MPGVTRIGQPSQCLTRECAFKREGEAITKDEILVDTCGLQQRWMATIYEISPKKIFSIPVRSDLATDRLHH